MPDALAGQRVGESDFGEGLATIPAETQAAPEDVHLPLGAGACEQDGERLADELAIVEDLVIVVEMTTPVVAVIVLCSNVLDSEV